MTTVDQSSDLLDEVNVRLLRELQDDPRATVAELARRVAMSPPAVAERLRRLRESGVVAGYRTVIDPAAVGLPVSAFVRIRPTAGQLPAVTKEAVDTPAVTECHRITGEDCLLLRVHAASIEALETTLDRFLLYGQTTTSIVVSSPVSARPLPLPGVSSASPAGRLPAADLWRMPAAGRAGGALSCGWSPAERPWHDRAAEHARDDH